MMKSLSFFVAWGILYLVNLLTPMNLIHQVNFVTILGLAGLYNPLKLSGKAYLIWLMCGLIFALGSYFIEVKSLFVSGFIGYLAIAWALQKPEPKQLGKLIILCGGIMNLFVIISTAHTDIQYDFASCYNYIQFVADMHFKFWAQNPIGTYPSYSSYHPILHFFLGALALEGGLSLTDNLQAANEAMQILFLGYMVWYYILCDKILSLFNLRPLAYLGGLLFICCFPLYNAIAGFFNNDCLLLPLQAGMIYYTLLYFKNGGIKNLVWIWNFTTLGALTKLSVILILPFTGILLLWRLCSHKQEFKQLALFGICLLLGLMIWPLYQHYMLGVGASFVPPQEHLSLKSYTLWERFNPLGTFFYADRYYHDFGINLWETMTKTALFGQWDFTNRIHNFALLLSPFIFCYKILLLFMWMGTVWLAFKRNKQIYLPLLLAGGILLGHIAFGLVHPYMCNQDFRYVGILTLPMALILSFIIDKTPKYISYLIFICVGIFALLSMLIWGRVML